MTSNSKLTESQKQARKSWLATLPRGSTIYTSQGVTVLCVPDGSVTRVYSSVASSHEKKIRVKVGEFYALQRWASDGGFILPGYWPACEVLVDLGFME